jgi:hypothetical protein
MQKIFIVSPLFALYIFLLSSVSGPTFSENIEEIIDSQNEMKTTIDKQDKKYLTEKTLMEESKDALKMGTEEYQQSCSICHGINATGKGEYANVLKQIPADLTQIKRNNNGVFPFSKLYRIIDGREEISSHGSRIMPIWGDRFNSENWLNMSPRYSETFVRGRIFELLLYLESIQK